MKIRPALWKGGKRFCLNLTYDDGRYEDYRLVEIFNKYGIKGTFNLNAGLLSEKGRHVYKKDIASLYEGHEVACHSYTHPTLTELPSTIILEEILRNKMELEQLWGHVVRGAAVPNAPYDTRVAEFYRSCNMRYVRTGNYTKSYSLPTDLMYFNPTCNENDDLISIFGKMLALPDFRYNMPYMSVVGHSYAIPDSCGWEHIEEFCREASQCGDVWFATNIEIADYVRAQRMIDYSIDKNMAYNPGAISVWITVDGQPVELVPGENKF